MRGESVQATHFVGRAPETALVHDLLGPDAPERLAYVEGPGGIGKTALLRTWAAECERRGRRIAWLDGASLPESRGAAWEAVTAALGVTARGPEELPAALEDDARIVVVIDAFEQLGELEAWLRDVLLPALPVDVAVLMAGRAPLASEWSLDPGWARLLRRVALGPLSRTEAATYLRSRDIPAGARDHLLDVCAGHPLALVVASNVVEKSGQVPAGLDAEEVTDVLLGHFVRELPTDLHELALEVLCLLGHLTEDLLADQVGREHAAQLFEWLARLAFVDRDPDGLVPHDLVREVVGNALVARDGGRYRTIVARARDFVARRWRRSDDARRRRLRRVTDYLAYHAMCVGGVIPDPRPFAPQPPLRAVGAPDVDDGTWREIETILSRYEGPESVRWLRLWRDRSTVVVVRDPTGAVAAFSCAVHLRGSIPPGGLEDPVLGAIAPLLERTFARGRAASLVRFWATREGHHGPDPYYSAVTHGYRPHFEELTDAGLLASAVTVTEPFLQAGEAAGIESLPAEPCRRGSLEYTWWGFELGDDETTETWWFEHELRILGLVGPRPAAPGPAPDAFRKDVMRSLRRLHDPRARPSARLLQMGSVARAAEHDGTDRAEALRDLLVHQCHMFDHAPRDEPVRRAIHATYLTGGRPQRAVAAELGMSFSTYRRHLTEGVRRIADALWELEHREEPRSGAGRVPDGDERGP